MPAEAAFSITAKNANNDLCTVRGDSYGEFLQNVTDAFGASAPLVLARFAGAYGAVATSAPDATAAAVAVVQQTFPQAAPVSTVGQPLPQPTAVAQPAAAPAGPPTVAYPGNCAHGVRVYVDKPARGKPWRRWECAIPWSKDAQGRCSALNVES